jgi:hypothetical protein
MVTNAPGVIRLVKLAPFWTAVTVTAVCPRQIPAAKRMASAGRQRVGDVMGT